MLQFLAELMELRWRLACCASLELCRGGLGVTWPAVTMVGIQSPKLCWYVYGSQGEFHILIPVIYIHI